jgi:hypothetical protein
MAVTATPLPAMGRAKPALTLLLCAALLAVHHWWAAEHGEFYPKLVLFFSMGVTWSIGGIVHPPAFHALTQAGKHLPRATKVLGAVFGLAGLALGFYLLLNVYE